MHLLDRLDKELSQGEERITITQEELDSLQRPLTILKSHFNTKEGEENEKSLWVCRLGYCGSRVFEDLRRQILATLEL